MNRPAETIRVGIVACPADTRETLRAQIQGLGLAGVAVEVDQYCVGLADRPTRRLMEARPDVVLIDMQDPQAGLHTLRLLHTTLPSAWLFVTSAANDPQLIIEAMRAGAREYLLQPIPARALSQAFSRLVLARERTLRQQAVGKLFCVASVKGGAGATTIAVNLAAAAAESSEARVAVVDLNAPAGDVAGYLNLATQYSLSDALEAVGRLDGTLLRSFLAGRDGVSVLPAPREAWDGSGTTAAALARVLEVVLEEQTHVFADLPAGADRELLRTVVEASAAVLVVLTSELPALWRAQRFLAALQEAGAADKARLVLNRARRGDEVSEAEVEKALGQPLFWKLPNNYPAAVRAINHGTPLVKGPGCDLGASIQTLARRLTGLRLGERRRGLFRGLLPYSTRPSNA